MPSHPDRVRANYEPTWWKDERREIPPDTTYWHPSLWLTALVLVCFALIGYFSTVGPQ